MLDEVLEEYTSDIREQIFASLKIPFTEATDLNGFENFVYAWQDQVIRITHHSHRSQEQLLAEIEFVDHLVASGASAARPLPFADGSTVSTVGNFHITRFEKAKGESLRHERYPEQIALEWGRCIGEFHRLVQGFSPVHRRPGWREDENHAFTDRIPSDQTDVIKAAEAVMGQLESLPVTDEIFGLIHSDAHPGNFLNDNGKLTFFDFDDSLYCWFGYDLATLLFHIPLMPWSGSSEEEKHDTVARFFSVFMRGYEQEAPRSALMLEQLPLFFKLREFSLYGAVTAHMGDDIEPGMPATFMAGRRERMVQGLPYLPLDLFDRLD